MGVKHVWINAPIRSSVLACRYSLCTSYDYEVLANSTHHCTFMRRRYIGSLFRYG